MFSIILSCVTEVRHLRSRGGSVIAAVFFARNYVSDSSVITSNTVYEVG